VLRRLDKTFGAFIDRVKRGAKLGFSRLRAKTRSPGFVASGYKPREAALHRIYIKVKGRWTHLHQRRYLQRNPRELTNALGQGYPVCMSAEAED
jgi:hypothetical protein